MESHVLIVEDEPGILLVIADLLRAQGHVIETAAEGLEGLRLATSRKFDLLILDVMLPGLDGFEICHAVREQGFDGAILMLTARGQVRDRVHGLQTGADDYLVKPFALEELLARVQALCRRTYGTKQPRLTVADLEIDTVTKEVTRAGQPVRLKPREYLLLEYLMARRGEVVSRSDIEAHIYDGEADPMSNMVESAVSSLRKKSMRRTANRSSTPGMVSVIC